MIASVLILFATRHNEIPQYQRGNDRFQHFCAVHRKESVTNSPAAARHPQHNHKRPLGVVNGTHLPLD